MGVPLSEDLRIRVIRAVEDGASRRRAAARFGVSVSSAIRWLRDWREMGRTASHPQGGDRRSDRIEAHADFLLAKVAATFWPRSRQRPTPPPWPNCGTHCTVSAALALRSARSGGSSTAGRSR